MDLSAVSGASAAPASILAARQAQDVYRTTAEALLATVRPPPTQDSLEVSAEAQALLAAEETQPAPE